MIEKSPPISSETKLSTRTIKKNIALMFLINFISALEFFSPIFTLYLEENLNSGILISAIFVGGSLTIVILEGPSGAFGDILGRKKILIIAAFGHVLALLFLILGGSIFWILLFKIIESIAMSLWSGIDIALIYDTLLHKPKETKDSFKKIIGIYNMLWPSGAILGALVGGILAEKSLLLPFIYTLIPWGICTILAFFLTEPPYEKPIHQSFLFQMKSSAKTIFNSRDLVLLIFTGFLAYATLEVPFQFRSVFFDDRGISTTYLGIISALSFVFSLLGSFFSDNISSRIGDKITLILSQALHGIFILIVTFISNPIILIGLFVFSSFFWGVRWPVMSYEINKRIKSSERATINSFFNLGKQAALVIFMPIFGGIMDLANVTFAFRIFTILQFGAAFLLIKLSKINDN